MDQDKNKQIGRNIRAFRKMRRLTQQELAVKVGCERTTITMIEGGKSNITLKMLYLIAEALGYDMQLQFKVAHRQPIITEVQSTLTVKL